jgi:glycerol-3-phosphate acyltransferase PlsX
MGRVFTNVSRFRGKEILKDIGLTNWAKKLDYTEYGGACLLGVNGNVIIAHGRSQARAIKSAISLAKETAERNITEKLKEEKHEQPDND